jgi:hypothetical protein
MVRNFTKLDCQDVFYENMTVEEFHAAVRPKVQVTRNLHDLLPKDLDFFICMSSIGGIVGSRGQGNYNAGKLEISSQYGNQLGGGCTFQT